MKQSIKDEGQHLPIIVNAQKNILDGHNRFRICKELQIPSRIKIRESEDPGKRGAEKRWKGGKEIDTPKESVSEDRVIQNYNTPSDAAEKTKGKGSVIEILAKNAQVSPATYNKGLNIIKQAPSPEIRNKLRTPPS
jgi:hypothetical protein